MNSSSTLSYNTNYKNVNINFNFATNIIIGGSWRGTSVVGLGFLPQNVGTWWGSVNGTLSFL